MHSFDTRIYEKTTDDYFGFRSKGCYQFLKFSAHQKHQNCHPIDVFFRSQAVQDTWMSLILDPALCAKLGLTSQKRAQDITLNMLGFLRDRAMADAIYSLLGKHHFKKDIIVIVGARHRCLFHDLLVHSTYKNIDDIRLLNLSGTKQTQIDIENVSITSLIAVT